MPPVPRIRHGSININGNSLKPPERIQRVHSISEGHYSPHIAVRHQLLRDCSFQVGFDYFINFKTIKFKFPLQSDESHCSSVESLLEQRKPDAEAILMNLGFGPSQGSDDLLSKIPKR